MLSCAKPFVSFPFLLLPSYTLYVIAMDQGVPPLNSSTLHLNITVVDENDNNPKFEQAMYSVKIWENETIGSYVLQVKATERDSAVKSQIGYNISAGDPQGHFKIFYHSVSTISKTFLFYFVLSSDEALDVFTKLF